MSEYLIKGETLTAIADEIRTLSGTTETMGLDAMATNVSDANTEIDNQVELLAQVVSALEGKAAGSGNNNWICINELPVTYPVGGDTTVTVYLVLNKKPIALFWKDDEESMLGIMYLKNNGSYDTHYCNAVSSFNAISLNDDNSEYVYAFIFPTGMPASAQFVLPIYC